MAGTLDTAFQLLAIRCAVAQRVDAVEKLVFGWKLAVRGHIRKSGINAFKSVSFGRSSRKMAAHTLRRSFSTASVPCATQLTKGKSELEVRAALAAVLIRAAACSRPTVHNDKDGMAIAPRAR
jgi:hypothetical protein